MNYSTLMYVGMQGLPVLFAFKAGKTEFAVATILWGLGNIVAFMGAK